MSPSRSKIKDEILEEKSFARTTKNFRQNEDKLIKYQHSLLMLKKQKPKKKRKDLVALYLPKTLH